MILRLAMAALLAAGFVASPRAQGVPQGVPEALRGAWAAGECAAPEALLFVTARAVVRLPAAGPARLVRFLELRELQGWTLGTAGGAEAPRVLLRAAGDALEEAEPDAKTRDDRLPGAVQPTRWRRCESLPAAWTLLHGEGLAFLAALEPLEAACGGADGASCLREVLRQGDVSGDGMLSSAEVSRLARGAAWLLASQEGSDADALPAVGGVSLLAGLAAARLLVESLDYDGDGKLSAAELLQDRAPLSPGLGAAAGSLLRLEGVSEGAGLLRALLEGLAGGR